MCLSTVGTVQAHRMYQHTACAAPRRGAWRRRRWFLSTMTRRTTTILALSTLAFSSGLAQASTVIDFDTLPANQVITNQFANQGVTFQGGETVSQGLYLYPTFEQGPEPSALGNYDNIAGDPLEGIIQANATTGNVFTSASADVSNWNGVSMSAYDANNVLLGTVSAPQFDPANPNVSNPTLPDNLLSLSYPDISYVQFNSLNNQPFSFILDGFTFNEAPTTSVATGITAVPEPVGLGIVLAAGAIAFRRRRRMNLPSK